MRRCPNQRNEGQLNQQEEDRMADRPLWLSFGTPNETGAAGTTLSSPPVLVEFHQPLHFALLDDGNKTRQGLSVLVVQKEHEERDEATILLGGFGVKKAGIPAPAARTLSTKVPWGTSSNSTCPLPICSDKGVTR